jgi:hypothetical protein
VGGYEPQVDESKAADYIGKVILIGVSYYTHDERLLEEKQWVGRIETFSNTEGIRIALFDSEETCCLPPDQNAIRRAEPGCYRLKSTGKIVENPDYLTTWRRYEPSPEEKQRLQREKQDR